MNLTEEVRALALDMLRAGWMRYGHLQDRTQVRCTWRQESGQDCLQVENLETGHKALFTLDVTATPLDPVPRAFDPDNAGCAPEECGGSRLDPCVTVLRTKGKAHDGEVEDHPFTVGEGATGMVCTAMVMRDGGGDACGLPASAHIPPHSLYWQVNRVAEQPEEIDGTWAEVRAGDQVQGEDGSWYDVVRSDPSALGTLYRSIQVVTMVIGGETRTYDMPGMGSVRIKLGEEHRAIRNLKAGFPGTEEVR